MKQMKDLRAGGDAPKGLQDIMYLYGKLERLYPKAYSELLDPVGGSPVDVLVATILSQATNDILSRRAFLELKRQCPAWETVLLKESSEVETILALGGLHRQKTKKIRNALQKLKEDFGHITLDPLLDWAPREIMKYLTSFSGIGPKTAACVIAFGLGKPAFPVDTHVLRITRRLGLAGEKQNAPSVQSMLEHLVPDEMKMSLHLMLIHHGRQVCTARNPKCGGCPLYERCAWDQKTLFAHSPPKPRTGPTQEEKGSDLNGAMANKDSADR